MGREHTEHTENCQCLVFLAILPGIAKLSLHASVSECHKYSLGESILDCYFILYGYVICKLHIYVIKSYYVSICRERNT